VCVAVFLVLLGTATAAVAGRTASDHFSGRGAHVLPPLRFPHAVTLRWRANDKLALVGIEAPRSFVSVARLVAKQGRAGSVHLPAGVYRLRVVTAGDWSLTIT
jgi:hypothetical protein